MTTSRRRPCAVITTGLTTGVTLGAIILLALGGMLTSCATPPVATETAEIAARSGELRTSNYFVEKGERIVVKDHLHIISEGEVVVLGEILGERGATIEITAPLITIRGTIHAGDGEDRNGVLEDGQDGGSVILNSPQIDLAGAVIVGGRGGSAGPAGNGGSGGDVALNDAVEIIADRARLIGGNGGRPGEGINGHGEAARSGGHGGSGGGVRQHRAARTAG